MSDSESEVQFNDLPAKALNQVFGYLDQTERQQLRLVHSVWKKIIEQEFQVELELTQQNFERLFRCPNAVTAEIQSLTSEYTGNVAFGSTLRSITFVGKVLSSNVFHILRNCPDLETLRFASLKNVMGIESTETIKLAKTNLIEIRVRPDQETFTSDEIIIMSLLKQMMFGALDTLLISTGVPLEGWELDDDDDGDGEGFNSRTDVDDSSNMFQEIEDGDVDDDDFDGNDNDNENQSRHLALRPNRNRDRSQRFAASSSPGWPRARESMGDSNAAPSTSGEIPISEEPQRTQDEFTVEEPPAQLDVANEDQSEQPVVEVQSPQSAGTQTTNQNLHVLINRGMNFPTNASESNSTATSDASRISSQSSSARPPRYNPSEFEARMFYANLEMMMDSSLDSATGNVLNDSLSRTRIDSLTYLELQGIPTLPVNHAAFFEFVRNNTETLKKLSVKTRSDFMCFGNLTSFAREVPKVQFDEVEYSFGRMQLCYEYILLRAQCQLKKIRVQILDDLWKHLMVAVQQSQETLVELDVKVMSVGEEREEIEPIMGCSNLKMLKLLHFFDRGDLCGLPKSIDRLILNGPISYKEMDTWTRELQELSELTMLLNVRGDKIDLELYKKFVKMPNMTKLTLIQCPIDLAEVKEYVETKINCPETAFKLVINGPMEITDLPSIQYVYTVIDPDKFNRDQIQLNDTPQTSEIN